MTEALGLVTLWVRPYAPDRYGVQRFTGDWRQLDPVPYERHSDGRLMVAAPLLQDLRDGQHLAIRLHDPTRRTSVAHVLHAPFDVYIGRHMGAYGLDGSLWGNPFRVTRTHSAVDACALYREYLIERPELLARLPELVGKTLGCWCKVRGDEACHGDILRGLLIERELIERFELRS